MHLFHISMKWKSIRYDKNSNMIFCTGISDCVIDLESERVNSVEYPEDWDSTFLTFDIYDGLVYVTNLETVAAVDKNGIVVREYKQPGYISHNMCVYETPDKKADYSLDD